MHRTAHWFSAATLVLAFAASACMTPPAPPTPAAPVVASSSSGFTSTPSAPAYTTTHPAPLKNAHVDKAQSEQLTDYFKAHHLPLVGAQVLSAPGGEKQLILFGYVATDYGKGDAESKARRYLNDPDISVDNRIRIEPSLAKTKSPSSSSESQSAEANNLSGVQAYENQRYEDQIQQQQQAYGYQSPPPSPMTTIIPLLGFIGGSFGGGSIGFGGGGFGGGLGGGYYPSTPPPTYYNYPSP